MSPLQSIRNDITVFTRCKWRGHIISDEELARIKQENKDENESECMYCHWPVIVRKDEYEPNCWSISED